MCRVSTLEHFLQIFQNLDFKAVFHEAKFFDRIEIFFCLTSTQMELNRNPLNLNNRNFGSIEKFRLVENRL
jgi:hypothetical protein